MRYLIYEIIGWSLFILCGLLSFTAWYSDDIPMATYQAVWVVIMYVLILEVRYMADKNNESVPYGKEGKEKHDGIVEN